MFYKCSSPFMKTSIRMIFHSTSFPPLNSSECPSTSARSGGFQLEGVRSLLNIDGRDGCLLAEVLTRVALSADSALVSDALELLFRQYGQYEEFLGTIKQVSIISNLTKNWHEPIFGALVITWPNYTETLTHQLLYFWRTSCNNAHIRILFIYVHSLHDSYLILDDKIGK